MSKKKFDTNPLDPEFPERARAAANTSDGRPNTAPQPSPYRTAEFPAEPGTITEEETRKFREPDTQAYWHNNYQPAGLYQPPASAAMNVASERKIQKVGIAEKWLIVLPYLPFSIGLVAGIVLLLVIPKEENRVRFHAAQGLAAHLGILIVSAILGLVGNVTGVASVGNMIFQIVTTIMLVISAIRAWQGKPVHIESIDDLTNWLEEKIGPVR